MATYLELVNKVLIGLRETEVADVTSPYAKLIGQFVNDAKAEVESRWHWKALRSEVLLTSIASTRSYTLTGPTARSVLLYDQNGMPLAFQTDAGQKAQLTEMSREDMRRYLETQNTVQVGLPTSFCVDRSSTGLTVLLDPLPPTVYNYKFIFYTPQDTLTTKTDVLSVPDEVVWRLALVYAMEERGSEFQGRVTTVAERAQRAMDDAILTEQGQTEFLTFVEG